MSTIGISRLLGSERSFASEIRNTVRTDTLYKRKEGYAYANREEKSRAPLC